MPSRDVEINLIAHDRTGQATRSAARNLEQLARKTEKIKTQKIKTKVDVDSSGGAKRAEQQAKRLNGRLRKIFHKGGFNAASAFGQGFINALTFGQANIGSSGIARKLSPKFASVGITVGAVFAAKLITTAATAITAGLSGVLAAGLLAIPVAFLLKQASGKATEEKASAKRIASLKKQLDSASTKSSKERIQKELAGERNVLAELHKQAQQWDRLKDKGKAFLTAISKPVQRPLERSITAIGHGLDALKKPVTDIMRALGPALVPFVKGVMQGLLNFINALKPALPGIVAGFKQWGVEIANIGGALGTALAGILKDPAKVVAAVKSISGTIQGLIGIAGILVSALTRVDLVWSKWGSGFNVGTIAGKSAAVQNAIVSMVIGIIGAIQKLLPAFQVVVSGVSHMMIALIEIWNNLPFTKKIDTGPLKEFSKAFDTEVPKWIQNLEGYKTAAKEAQRKIKLRADAKDAEAKVKALKAKLKTVPKDKQTKIKAEIAQAEAHLRRIQGEINQLHGKQVDIWIKTHRATYYSVHGNKGHVPTNPKAGSGAPGSNAAMSWGGNMLDGGGMARAGGPTPVNVAAPIVDTRVFIDSGEIRAVTRSTVVDENRRNAYRSRVGRR